MDITRVVYEGGIEVISLESGIWQVAGCQETIPVPGFVTDQYTLRPILISDQPEGRERRDFVYPQTAADLLDVVVSSLASSLSARLLQVMLALTYDIGAVVYHCKQMANAYAAVGASHYRIRGLYDAQMKEANVVSFMAGDDIYYEFDALLSAARRAYDKLGNLVWNDFGDKKGGRPDNFADTLKRTINMPGNLADWLQRSWDSFGVTLKDYRDCTQHFASADIGLCTLNMQRLSGDVWRTLARIPDNPGAKSKRKFTYEKGLDALTYGWEVCNEVVKLAAEVVAIVPQ